MNSETGCQNYKQQLTSSRYIPETLKKKLL